MDTIDPVARRRIAESIVGQMNERGYCVCPGQDLHTNKVVTRPDKPGKDCRVYLDKSATNPRGVPTIRCVHTSCGGAVADKNRQLRSEIGKHEAKLRPEQMERPKAKRRTAEEKEQAKEEHRKLCLSVRAKCSMPRMFKQFAWPRQEMWACGAPDMEPSAQARALLGLFAEEDTVWCGEHRDSISADDLSQANEGRIARVRGCFRLRDEWIMRALRAQIPGPRICPASFKEGTLSRSNETIARKRFLVVEHDSLSMEEQAAGLRWLHEGYKLKLRAIVFTGGKSLHGWFEYPPANTLPDLETILVTGMGYDPATFRPAQPYRLPGWKHDKTGNHSELWWLAK